MPRRFAIVSISIIISLLLSEAILRLFHPAPEVFRFLLGDKESAYEISDNPLLGYQLKANLRVENPDCHNTFDYTNSFGQRDIERQIRKTDGKRRIIMLGDSVVAGSGLCSVKDTITQRLENLFPAHDTEVMNFGVGGFCTRGEVELLKEKGLQFRPDEVFLIFVNNDYVNSNGSILAQLSPKRPRFVEWAFQHSHIVRWATLGLNLFGFAEDFDPAGRMNENIAALGDDNVESGMKLLAQLSVENHFRARVFLWPVFNDSGIEEPWPKNADRGAAELPVEILMNDLGIENHRLSDFFREDFQKKLAAASPKRKRPLTPRWVYTIGDGTHPSKLGAVAAAEGIFEVVVPKAPS